ncbi:major facilitator superfamily domain-containing protein [Linnemannia elongata]|nr:major facilitator superfamily domain-containing protein [Linnemannia elongata]
MAEDTTNALQVAEKGKLEVEHPHSIDSVPTSVDGEVEENGEAEVEEIGDEGVLPTGYVDQSRVLPRKELVFVFVALMIVIFLASLDQTIVSVLIPALGKAFNAPQYIAWVGTSYLLTNTATQPLYGKLSDIFGRKNTIIAAILLFLVGSLICGAAPSMNVLIFGRALSGSGAGGMISLTLIIISDVVSMRDRGKYQGIIGSMFGLSSVIGPLLGGVLAEKSTWRWGFYLNLPLGAVGTAIIMWILRLPAVEGTRQDKLKRVDFLGSFTIVIGIVCVLLSTNWGGNEYAWNSVQIIVPYVVGGLFLLAFLYVEAKVAVEPIMPYRLFRNRSVSSAYATSFFVGGAFMGAIFYCPLYFQMVKHYNATKAGIHLLPMVAGMLVGGIGGGIAVSKTGRYRPFIWGALIIYTTGIALLSLWDENSGLGIQIGFLFLVGLGLGGCMQNIVLAGQCAVSQADIATVTSLMSFFRSMGGVVCVAIGGSLINNILTQNGVDPNNFAVIYTHPEIYAKATQAIFRQCIAWPVLAFISSLFLKHHVLRKTVREETAGEA